MTNQQPQKKNSTTPIISTFSELANLANYSFMDRLNCDPDATENGVDHTERQVFSGHYVPVKPTPIKDPQYVAHSKRFFAELGLADGLAESADFIRLFSGDITQVPEPMRKVGWATGYALSIYGVEFIHQCPFQTGNGYGDGRAISVLEAVINGQRWEMQLKGGGRTPYCRGADGRAVLRSSVREFLAQDHMHALGVATSRSLSLYVSKTETVQRGWYAEGSRSENPDMMVTEPVAISTRVAPSFLRVGQIELFARRTRDDGEYDEQVDEQLHAIDELEKIVLHLIDREYAEVIDKALSTPEKIVQLACEFRERLTSLIANWIRVGFCQGNFNSDNCAAGGFTLDYGPFGFSDLFNPHYQPWTGGGNHFSFMNQSKAAQSNFEMFCSALKPLLATDQDALSALEDIQSEFSTVMESKMQAMWAAKLGLSSLDKPEHMAVLRELQMIMMQTPIDYTIFFRELSSIPNDIRPLKKSFYTNLMHKSAEQEAESQQVDTRWIEWFVKWKALLISDCNANAGTTLEDVSKQMKQVNPKYILREWLLKPAYQQAAVGDYSLIQELQEVMANPYEEQSQSVEDKFYRLKPLEFFNVGGVSHLSCSS
ncbi:protein adenylyltransferase SelO [Psychromonas sp.]|uniref:protein adenylyltransferase SelO n=1 Tax=Psychromonas sp. TaxID=1884585 RepID=UPI003A976D9F